MLFRRDKAPPEVVPYLRKALDSEPEGKFGLGPGFQDFKDAVIRAYEVGKQMKVELVKQHTIQEFPEFGDGFAYTNDAYVFAPGPLIYAVRPLSKQNRGELFTYDLASGKAHRRIVPQPDGFKPRFEIPGYFDTRETTLALRTPDRESARPAGANRKEAANALLPPWD